MHEVSGRPFILIRNLLRNLIPAVLDLKIVGFPKVCEGFHIARPKQDVLAFVLFADGFENFQQTCASTLSPADLEYETVDIYLQSEDISIALRMKSSPTTRLINK